MRLPVSRQPREGSNLENANAVAEFLCLVGSGILVSEKNAEPMLCLIKKEEVLFISIAQFFESPGGKDLLAAFIAELCEDKDVDGMGLVTEAWVVSRPLEQDLTTIVIPRECPDREEVLMVYSEWRDLTSKDIMIPFTRDSEDRPILGERIVSDVSDVAGRLRNFFIPELKQ